MNRAPLKIVFATTSYPRGPGDHAAPFIASLAEAIAALGHQVCVVAPHERGVSEHELVGGVTVRRFRYAPERIERLAYGSGIVENLRRRPLLALEIPAFALALRRTVRAQARDAQVVHAHWAQTTLMAGRQRGPVLLTTIHGTDLALADRPLWSAMLRRALRISDGVIAGSVSSKERLETAVPAVAGIVAIPVGLDAGLLARPVSFQRPAGAFDVLCVGRIIEAKGVYDLLRAFARVDAPATLSFVGSGDDLDHARALATRLGISERVRFEGPLPHAAALERMGRAHLVVSASHREGFGATAVEAAAVGTPAVVTDTGDMPMYTGDPGAVVAVGDTQGLTAAIQRFLSDEDLRVSAARIAHTRVADLSWESIAHRTVDAYERALEVRR
ncbi:MAG: glycosyltransferase [Coriobacteriia bacterium]